MNKQKRIYNIARIRPTSYSHFFGCQEIEKKQPKNNSVFSNLLQNYNYEKLKIKKPQKSSPKISFSEFQVKTNLSIKPFEIGLKQFQNNHPIQKFYFSERNSFNKQRKHPSNYSLYIERSINRKTSNSSQRLKRQDNIPQQLSMSELETPCKVRSIKMQTRKIEPPLNLKDFRQSIKINRKKKPIPKKNGSYLVLNKKNGDQMIEPWGMKNYQSITF